MTDTQQIERLRLEVRHRERERDGISPKLSLHAKLGEEIAVLNRQIRELEEKRSPTTPLEASEKSKTTRSKAKNKARTRI